MHFCPTRALAVAVLVLLAALPARAETLGEFDKRISAELRARDAAAAALFEQANAARNRGDHASAIALYRQVRAAQPTFSHATRRLAAELMVTKQEAEALLMFREAATVDASPLNRSSLAMALVSPRAGGPPPDAERKEAATICGEVHRALASDPQVEYMCAQVALVTNSAPLLASSIVRLEQIAPGQMETRYFAAVAHATRGELLRADLDLWRARQSGLPEQEYRRLRTLFHAVWPWWLTVGVWTVVAVAAWLVAMLVLLVLGLVLSRATLAEATRLPASGSGTAVPRRAASLRRVYAGVIGLAGTAYYLSLPLLFLVVVLVGGGLIVGLLAVGHVPIKLLFIIAITVLWTCWSILKSLSVFAKEQDPGVRVDLAENPRLEGVLVDVARQIGTRRIDAVFLTPGTEFGVTERGGVAARARGSAQRTLLLGVGVLEGFGLRAFKAVLAHEYGHFVNRDTAGGRFSLSVRRSMFKMAQSLAASGSSRLSPAWLFLIAFSRLFERISQGASRLQEVMADRWAVSAYGAQAFCAGLRHVIERSARFQLEVQATFQEMNTQQRALTNLYAHSPSAALAEEDIRRAIDEALNREASPYDSHPSPRQRFEWAAQLGGPGDAAGDEAVEAWALFADKTAVETMMTAHVLGQA